MEPPFPKKPGMMSTFTSMAIDAFRKQTQARRRLDKAETASLRALRLVPEDEIDIWFKATEKIRAETEETP